MSGRGPKAGSAGATEASQFSGGEDVGVGVGGSVGTGDPPAACKVSDGPTKGRNTLTTRGGGANVTLGQGLGVPVEGCIAVASAVGASVISSTGSKLSFRDAGPARSRKARRTKTGPPTTKLSVQSDAGCSQDSWTRRSPSHSRAPPVACRRTR